jgi:hypothetical protein
MSDVTFSVMMMTTAIVPDNRVGPRATTANESASARVASNPRGTLAKPRVSDAMLTALLAKFGKTWNPPKAK